MLSSHKKPPNGNNSSNTNTPLLLTNVANSAATKRASCSRAESLYLWCAFRVGNEKIYRHQHPTRYCRELVMQKSDRKVHPKPQASTDNCELLLHFHSPKSDFQLVLQECSSNANSLPAFTSWVKTLWHNGNPDVIIITSNAVGKYKLQLLIQSL